MASQQQEMASLLYRKLQLHVSNSTPSARRRLPWGFFTRFALHHGVSPFLPSFLSIGLTLFTVNARTSRVLLLRVRVRVRVAVAIISFVVYIIQSHVDGRRGDVMIRCLDPS